MANYRENESRVTRRQLFGLGADVIGNFATGYGLGLLGEQAGVKIDGANNPQPFLPARKNYVIEGGIMTAGGVAAIKAARHFSPDGNTASNDKFAWGGYQGFVTGSFVRGIVSWYRSVT